MLAFEIGCGYGTLLDREERISGSAIEEEYEATLSDLGDGVDQSATASHRHKIGSSRQIAIPEVVVDCLEVPDAFTRSGVERQQCVGEQVCAKTIAPVEIRCRRAGGI